MTAPIVARLTHACLRVGAARAQAEARPWVALAEIATARRLLDAAESSVRAGLLPNQTKESQR